MSKSAYRSFSSRDVGLALGVVAMLVKKDHLRKDTAFQAGGGTARLTAPDWIIWAGKPDKFEGGTPAIINIITFAAALKILKQKGIDRFDVSEDPLTVKELLYHDALKDSSGIELLEKLRDTHIGKDLKVPTTEGQKTFINLDNSASTPTFKPIWETFSGVLFTENFLAGELVSEVRSIIAKTLHAPTDKYDIIFTSNTTEAINIVSESCKLEPLDDFEPVIANTLLEHSSNDLPWRLTDGFQMIRIGADKDGFIDLQDLENKLKAYNQDQAHGSKRIKLVAVSGASNVVGAANDLAKISGTVKKYGAKLLVDAAQLVAHRKVDVELSGVDFLAFSGHKVYAPFGCGVLIARKGALKQDEVELQKLVASGDENAAGIAALGKSLLLLGRIGMDTVAGEEKILTASLLEGLSKIEGVKVYGIDSPEHPQFDRKLGVVSFNIGTMEASRTANKLARTYGIGIRFGCHCAHIYVKHLLDVGPGLERFQRVMITLLPQVNLPGMARASLGLENTQGDVDALVEAVRKIREKSKNSMPTGEVKKLIKAFVHKSAAEVYS